ncbi:VWA domain-containing protein [Alteromonas halophila]|uniref:VWFA domain-containing protein n=1 Tax=Alteromonas halophila TaxID=516698 RepID=A0A918MTU6_9ALTE|nr:VWA domain-containing protein [Alteromonas halophila]GGW74501.1 hypothetical protein GCM10007391_03090 [Alteromonas halophila]
MSAALEHFHFLRPEWLLALLPLAALLLLLVYMKRRHSGWQQVIPAHLYKHMVSGHTLKQSRPPYGLLAAGWMVAVIALAGPTWERLPQPVFQLNRGHVVLIDMSLSMRATDVTPDRLTRAKYKAIDLVNALGEGETGLVAYAGDAFVISPLTEDVSNITTLLPSLRPEIMPVAGSDPLLGFQTAYDLLTNAGYQRGDIYWITDGIEVSQISELKNFIGDRPFTVNILGVGTEDGAPIRQLDGELLKDASGSIVIPRMQADQLRQISRTGNGEFATLKADDSDIKRLSALDLTQRETDSDDNPSLQGDAWREAGPYLVVLLLPLAAYGFRRGLLFAFLCLSLVPFSPAPAVAQQQTAPASATQQDYSPPSWWQKPFMNANQQGLHAYQQNAYEVAANTFTHPAWQGAAHYKAENYQAALDAFSQLDTTPALYNQGNALAHLGQIDDAIEKYEQVLLRDPDHKDAAANKALLEQLKEQQQNQQEQQQQNQQDNSLQQNRDGENPQNPQNGQRDNQNGENSNNDGQSGDTDTPQEPDNQGISQDQNGEQSSQNDRRPQNEGEPQSQSDTSQEDSPEQPARDDDKQDNPAQSGVAEDQQAPQDPQRAATASQGELSDEEKEAQQRLENLMRRVPDDPAFLLKRKMQLEAQKRQRQRLPANRRDW